MEHQKFVYKVFLAVFWTHLLSSVLWHCWLGIRKSFQPLKNWVMRCWCGYLSATRCRLFAYGPADATAILKSIISCLIARLVLVFVVVHVKCIKGLFRYMKSAMILTKCWQSVVICYSKKFGFKFTFKNSIFVNNNSDSVTDNLVLYSCLYAWWFLPQCCG